MCGPILSLRLFSDTFRAEQEGQLRSLLHLFQRGREEDLLKVVVTVWWLCWPCTGTRAASTCVFLNCEYSQYVSAGIYLNKIRGLRGVWWTQTKSSGTYVTLPVHSHPTSTETVKNCVITSSTSVCECYSVCSYLYGLEVDMWHVNMESVNKLIK